MSSQAIIDYLHLWHTVVNVQLSDQPDRTVWRWTPSGEYSAKSTYVMLQSGSCRFAGHKLIWKTWAPLKVKIFLWLAFQRKHWTADRRRRHGLEAADSCYLCDQVEESIDHIITSCPFTREVWFFVLKVVGLQLPQAAQSVRSWWARVRSGLDSERRSGMDSLFALMSWQIWKERNARCFRNATATATDTLQLIKAEVE
jgi:hypothetical protein